MKIKIYTCFSNDYNINRTDNVEILNAKQRFQTGCMDAKIYKILGHLFFPDYDILIWIDGNIQSKLNEIQLVEKYLGNNDFSIAKHPFRNNIFEEFEEIINTNRLESIKDDVIEQRNDYLKKYRSVNELFECNFFIRKNNPAVNTMMCNWFAETCRYSQRDQLSFPIIKKKFEKHIKFNIIDLYNIRNHNDFIYHNHY